MMDTFFKNLKVLELASVLAGPTVGMFFAELGAEVIKIENKTTDGDVTRSWKLPSEPKDAEGSAYFYAVNYKKQHYFFDLESVVDREKVYAMVKDCDIVISNFRKSSAVKLGMDYNTLRKHTPSVIYGQIYGFDEDDETPAFDVVLQAEAGFMYMCGERGGNPVKMPVALIDLLAAHQLKEGLLIALLHRERTGEGAFVSASLYESAVASLVNQASNWLMTGHIPNRIGSEHPNIAPYGDIFETADGKEIVLACGTEKQWRGLCIVLNQAQLIEDERFISNQKRVFNRNDLNTILKNTIKEWDREKLLSQLRGGNVPAGAIRNMPEVFENNTAKDMILKENNTRGVITKRVKTISFKIPNLS
jgi:crotonobetainyl-CoA:carnitine CoA-transferase CaiB-like acyl-CoA transferase